MTTNKNKPQQDLRFRRKKKLDWYSVDRIKGTRKHLADQFAALGQRRLIEARNYIDSIRTVAEQRATTHLSNAWLSALQARIHSVCASYGAHVDLSIKPDGGIAGNTYTDGETISLGLKDAMEHPNRDLGISLALGAAYHELGHVLFSPSTRDVHAHITSKCLYDAKYTRVPEGHAQGALNVLEDARVEVGMVGTSPRLAEYFTVLYSYLVAGEDNPRPRLGLSPEQKADLYIHVAGRQFLPPAVKVHAETLSLTSPTGPETFHSRKWLRDVEQVFDRYLAIEQDDSYECFSEMAQCALDLAILATSPLTQLTQQSARNSHDQGRVASNYRKSTDDQKSSVQKGKEQGKDKPQPKSNEKPETEEEQGRGEDESDTEAPDEGESDTEGESEGESEGAPGEGEGESDTEGEGAPDEGESDTGTGTGEDRDDMVRGIAQAIDAYLANPQSDVLPFDHPRLQDLHDPSRAYALAEDLERAFHTANADNEPFWVSQQRQGIIEPLRYVTREPGDQEFRRNLSERGGDATSLRVTLFFDNSGSMEPHEEALGAVMWAAKTALQNLGIPCGVFCFNSVTESVYGYGEHMGREPFTFPAYGGTNPGYGLEVLLLEDAPEVKLDLVLIMTDGAWARAKDSLGATLLARYAKPNRKIVMFYYDEGAASALEALTKSDAARDSRFRMLSQYGADENLVINDLAQLVERLQLVLTESANQ